MTDQQAAADRAAQKDRLRAQVLRAHTYRTDHDTGLAHCQCGETHPMIDFSHHVDQAVAAVVTETLEP